jgi:hypothetical protein
VLTKRRIKLVRLRVARSVKRLVRGRATEIIFASEAGFLFFAVAFRLVLGSAKPPVQSMQSILLPGIKGPEHESDDRPTASEEVKNR